MKKEERNEWNQMYDENEAAEQSISDSIMEAYNGGAISRQELTNETNEDELS